MSKKLFILFSFTTFIISCTEVSYNCSKELIVEINEPFDKVLETFKFEKRIDNSKLGQYYILSWTKQGMQHKPYLGQELLSLDIDSERKIKKLYFVISCNDEFVDCSDFKLRTDQLILKHFGCIPNIDRSIASLNKEMILIYENNEISTYSIDLKNERTIIIARK